MTRNFAHLAWLRRRRHRLLNAAVDALPTYAWAPFDLPGTLLYLSAGQLRHQFVEINGTSTPAVTRVAAAADLVGQVASPVGGHLAQAPADTARPTYRMTPPRWEFDGSADRLIVHNSAAAFNCFHNTGVGTLLIRAAVRSNGANEQIIDNMNWSLANRGVTLAKTSGNFAQFQVGRGVAGAIFSFTSTVSWVAASGMCDIVVRVNNAAGGDFRISPTGGALGTLETFARTNAPVAGNALSNLFIGKSSVSSLFGDIDVQDLLISDQYLSDADVARWRAWAPGVEEPATYLRQVALPGAGVPCFNFLHRWHDFRNAGTSWQDTARTVAVAANDDPIRVVDHRGDATTQPLNRTIVAPSDAARALYQADGLGAAFDGVDDEYVANDTALAAGARTWVLVWQQDDVDLGVNLAMGDAYFAVSGRDYPGNADFEGVAYTVTHVAGASPSVAQMSLGSAEGYNVLVVSRDGATWYAATRGGGTTRTTGPEVSGGAFTIESFGRSWHVDPFEFDGRYVLVITYQEALDPEQIQVEIAAAVANFPAGAL